MSDDLSKQAIKKYIEPFLLANGFVAKDPTSFFQGLYENDKVLVYISHDDTYNVNWKGDDGGDMYSKDLNIYWLIGILTWYDVIPKNYNKPQNSEL